ncbi:chemotaxis protein CheA [Zobellella maritima]|uniref:chemotaxis protein CheA n=1 Tax=Zobellella maritima TaxID=2059725 RepID=UPI000E306356|nr:chemotaxis protein CheA [Zobellella maritima]
MDLSDFYDTFFEEAGELLEEMERHLLALDVEAPGGEQLNAIFRAAHSIKGGAGTFGFDALQASTHLLENLLDAGRRGELTLRRDIVDTFLETKDMLQDQLDAYRQGGEPDPDAYQRICRVLQQLALEERVPGEPEAGGSPQPAQPAPVVEPPAPDPIVPVRLQVTLLGVGDRDRQLLLDELALFGEIVATREQPGRLDIELLGSVSAEDIAAVMCFIVEPEQLEVQVLGEADPSLGNQAVAAEAPEPAACPVPAPDEVGRGGDPAVLRDSDTALPLHREPGRQGAGEASSLRVPVAKIDQIINLVGELIITQSMLVQTVSGLDSRVHGALSNSIKLLERNARDLQEAVMTIRMVPMDYVFSRFPRLVRDLAARLGKEVELVTRGESTELDKSLTERIIDPLTHLVRNSLDHGIEAPEHREAAGKPRVGRLTLSARHQGGNILIEVDDDGAGLDRARLLAKARDSGVKVSDTISDEEVWQLIFAPGFSTAEQVSDVSGRGVGMDVVKRNIQAMGGQVELMSRPGQGTRTRILLPLTLAILDGMLVRVGEEVFILPLSAVIESLQPTGEQLHAMGHGATLLRIRGEYLPLIAAYQVLDVAGSRTRPTEGIAVIVQGEGRRYALQVDELLGQRQLVVKNLETNYGKVPGISAATILGDGSVALILDIADIHRLSHMKAGMLSGQTGPSAAPAGDVFE